MFYEKINSYTWVVGSNKGKTKERFSSSRNYAPLETLEKKKISVSRSRSLDYIKFCKRVFSNRKMISLREFRKLVKSELNPSQTWYIKRLVALNLISIKYGIVRPAEKL